MAAQYHSRLVDDVAGLIRRADQFPMVAAVEVLAVGCFRHREAVTARVVTHLGLGHAAQREELTPQLLLREAVEEVGLIAGGFAGAQQPVASPGLIDAGVVARGKGAAGQSRSPCQFRQQAELEQRVAAHTGIGGASGEIFGAEVGDNLLFKGLAAVEGAEGQAEAPAEGLGGAHAVRLARAEAGITSAAGIAALAPAPHHDARDVVSLVFQQQRGDRGIDTRRSSRQ
jgi:hypothetical protein